MRGHPVSRPRAARAPGVRRPRDGRPLAVVPPSSDPLVRALAVCIAQAHRRRTGQTPLD